MTDILRRAIAPVTDEAWHEIDEEAARLLKPYLSGRHIVDLSGPHGWEKAAVNLGRVAIENKDAADGVGWGRRPVLPLIEVRVPFRLNQLELDNVTRGSADPDLAPLEDAVRRTAGFEEKVIYAGFKEAGMRGIMEASEHGKPALGKEVRGYPEAVAKGIELMQLAGISGPYALILAPEKYHRLMQSFQTGYPVARVIRDMVQGGVHWSTAVPHALLVSVRGGDFELTVGQDLSIGYASHDRDDVELYITETFAFRVLEPKAAVAYKA
jgi:uncharacterized linocin/CFP29 family protein